MCSDPRPPLRSPEPNAATRLAGAALALLLVASLACASTPPLIQAARDGDVDEIERLIAEGADPGTRRSNGRNALHSAARRGRQDAARALLARGVGPNVRDDDGNTALLFATHERDLAMVELLLAAGADPSIQNRRRESPLTEAAEREQIEIAERLLAAGAPVDARTRDRETALLIAVKKKEYEFAEVLLAHHADPNLADRNGRTPLQMAASEDEPRFVAALLAAGADPNRQGRDRRSALHDAVRSRDVETVERLLAADANPNTRDQSGESPLMTAVRARDRELTRMLLAEDADPEVPDVAGFRPLLIAVMNRDRAIAELLLAEDANPDVIGPDGAPALIVATRGNDQEMIELLLENDADPEAFDKQLADPAGFAQRYGVGALAQAMVEKGLNEAFQSMQNPTPTGWVAPPPPPFAKSEKPQKSEQPDLQSESPPPVRNASEREPAEDYEPFYSKRIAVVVGIDRYHAYPALEGATRDARRVAEQLRGMAFDEVIEIYDAEATRTKLLRVLGSELARRTDRDSFALIYFAGHGETETLPNGQKRGYVVPADADPENAFATAISMDSLRDLSNRLPAKQIYYAMDSCYSGLAFVRGLRPISQDGAGFVEKVTSMRAVQMITAGAEGEQAIELGGQGLFTTYFLRALGGEADFDSNGYVTASEIGTFVRPHVTTASRSRQTPQFGTLEGAGEVVFELP